MYLISVEDKISSAHQLKGYKGKCENLHGHNWRVILTVKGSKLNETGMLIDFHDLKSILKSIINGLDHKNLNETEFFLQKNPTTENISEYIFHKVNDELKLKGFSGVCVDSVKSYETDGNCCEYKDA